tara:strand:- start:1533 stop:2480 length:948 start_codon:yes stop_codon:yes gene_type:complete
MQFYLFSRGQESNRTLINFSSLFVYLGLVVFLIIIVSEHSNDLFNSFKLSTITSNYLSKENFLPLISITGTMFAYFSIVLLSYGDFSRSAINIKEMKKGNLSLVLNLVIFSFLSVLIVLGSEIILTKNAIQIDRMLTNPNDIIAKFDNTYLTFVALCFIIVSSFSSNLIANYIPSQNTLINFLPNSLNLKKSGLIILFTGLLVAIFWLSIFSHRNVLIIFDTLGAIFGPIFGIIVADYYLIKKQKINHKELFYPVETTEYIYYRGWNRRAIYALLIGFIFSASTIWNISLTSFQSFSWIIGAFISYLLYYLLSHD